jgi:hypothetical protein
MLLQSRTNAEEATFAVLFRAHFWTATSQGSGFEQLRYVAGPSIPSTSDRSVPIKEPIRALVPTSVLPR